MFDEVKKLLVENLVECPTCGETLNKGCIMYRDEYRSETFCGGCKEDYIESVYQAEGENGEFVR